MRKTDADRKRFANAILPNNELEWAALGNVAAGGPNFNPNKRRW